MLDYVREDDLSVESSSDLSDEEQSKTVWSEIIAQ